MICAERRSSTRQIAFGLCNSCLAYERIEVVRYDVENLIKLSQRFRETTKGGIASRVLSEQVNVARIEPLGFVEIRLAPVPLAPPPRDIGQRFRNPAAIGQELTCLFKVTHCGVVILQASVIVLALGQHGLAEIGLKS